MSVAVRPPTWADAAVPTEPVPVPKQVAITGHDHVSAEEPRCIAAAAQQTRAAAARTRPNSPPRSPSRASPRCPPLPRARSGQ